MSVVYVEFQWYPYQMNTQSAATLITCPSDWLNGVLHTNQEYFTYMETWPDIGEVAEIFTFEVRLGQFAG